MRSGEEHTSGRRARPAKAPGALWAPKPGRPVQLRAGPEGGRAGGMDEEAGRGLGEQTTVGTLNCISVQQGPWKGFQRTGTSGCGV